MQTSWKPTAAGVLAIIGGALNLLVALAVSLFMPIAAPFRYAFLSVGAIGLLWLATGIIAIVGGVFALQRRRWGLSLAGAICALMPPSTLLGIASTVFVALGREEFQSGTTLPDDSESRLLSAESACAPEAECAPCDASLSQPSEGERNA